MEELRKQLIVCTSVFLEPTLLRVLHKFEGKLFQIFVCTSQNLIPVLLKSVSYTKACIIGLFSGLYAAIWKMIQVLPVSDKVCNLAIYLYSRTNISKYRYKSMPQRVLQRWKEVKEIDQDWQYTCSVKWMFDSFFLCMYKCKFSLVFIRPEKVQIIILVCTCLTSQAPLTPSYGSIRFQ